MDRRRIVRLRMDGQRLWGRPLETPQDVVRHLGALQAQELSLARWSVAQRAAGVDALAMDRALAEGSILRTHALRPTWHFVLPADIRWILQVTAPRVQARNARPYRREELDGKLLDRSTKAIARALEGGRQLTRAEVASMLARSKIAAAGPRLSFILMHAELEAVVCSGAPRGKQQTYALLEERAPNATTLDRDTALAELTRRYFTARGPATLKDFVWWSSLRTADARAGLDMVASELRQEAVGNRVYWLAASTRTPRAAGTPRIDLVQGYDEIAMSYTESRDVLVGANTRQEQSRGRPLWLHALLLDGTLAGHWRTVTKGTAHIVETTMSRWLSPDEEKALDAALNRYARFVGAPVARA